MDGSAPSEYSASEASSSRALPPHLRGSIGQDRHSLASSTEERSASNKSSFVQHLPPHLRPLVQQGLSLDALSDYAANSEFGENPSSISTATTAREAELETKGLRAPFDDHPSHLYSSVLNDSAVKVITDLAPPNGPTSSDPNAGPTFPCPVLCWWFLHSCNFLDFSAMAVNPLGRCRIVPRIFKDVGSFTDTAVAKNDERMSSEKLAERTANTRKRTSRELHPNRCRYCPQAFTARHFARQQELQTEWIYRPSRLFPARDVRTEAGMVESMRPSSLSLWSSISILSVAGRYEAQNL
ncbi:hypothetical protein CI102_14309 [Trichoderma harzianum]|nr:hypothetical protein CI102_14309 [Trichoderma harzianum]